MRNSDLDKAAHAVKVATHMRHACCEHFLQHA